MHTNIIIIIKVFLKHTVLSLETILSAFAHTHTQFVPHTEAPTHTEAPAHTSIKTIQNQIYTA